MWDIKSLKYLLCPFGNISNSSWPSNFHLHRFMVSWITKKLFPIFEKLLHTYLIQGFQKYASNWNLLTAFWAKLHMFWEDHENEEISKLEFMPWFRQILVAVSECINFTKLPIRTIYKTFPPDLQLIWSVLKAQNIVGFQFLYKNEFVHLKWDETFFNKHKVVKSTFICLFICILILKQLKTPGNFCGKKSLFVYSWLGVWLGEQFIDMEKVCKC